MLNFKNTINEFSNSLFETMFLILSLICRVVVDSTFPAVAEDTQQDIAVTEKIITTISHELTHL